MLQNNSQSQQTNTIQPQNMQNSELILDHDPEAEIDKNHKIYQNNKTESQSNDNQQSSEISQQNSYAYQNEEISDEDDLIKDMENKLQQQQKKQKALKIKIQNLKHHHQHHHHRKNVDSEFNKLIQNENFNKTVKLIAQYLSQMKQNEFSDKRFSLKQFNDTSLMQNQIDQQNVQNASSLVILGNNKQETSQFSKNNNVNNSITQYNMNNTLAQKNNTVFQSNNTSNLNSTDIKSNVTIQKTTQIRDIRRFALKQDKDRNDTNDEILDNSNQTVSDDFNNKSLVHINKTIQIQQISNDLKLYKTSQVQDQNQTSISENILNDTILQNNVSISKRNFNDTPMIEKNLTLLQNNQTSSNYNVTSFSLDNSNDTKQNNHVTSSNLNETFNSYQNQNKSLLDHIQSLSLNIQIDSKNNTEINQRNSFNQSSNNVSNLRMQKKDDILEDKVLNTLRSSVYYSKGINDQRILNEQSYLDYQKALKKANEQKEQELYEHMLSKNMFNEQKQANQEQPQIVDEQIINDIFLQNKLQDNVEKNSIQSIQNHDDYEHDSDKDFLIKKNEEQKAKNEVENLRKMLEEDQQILLAQNLKDEQKTHHINQTFDMTYDIELIKNNTKDKTKILENHENRLVVLNKIELQKNESQSQGLIKQNETIKNNITNIYIQKQNNSLIQNSKKLSDSKNSSTSQNDLIQSSQTQNDAQIINNSNSMQQNKQQGIELINNNSSTEHKQNFDNEQIGNQQTKDQRNKDKSQDEIKIILEKIESLQFEKKLLESGDYDKQKLEQAKQMVENEYQDKLQQNQPKNISQKVAKNISQQENHLKVIGFDKFVNETNQLLQNENNTINLVSKSNFRNQELKNKKTNFLIDLSEENIEKLPQLADKLQNDEFKKALNPNTMRFLKTNPNKKVILNFVGTKCPDNHICVFPQDYAYDKKSQDKVILIDRSTNALPEDFECYDQNLCISVNNVKKSVVVKLGNREMTSQAGVSGLYMLVLNRDQDYSKEAEDVYETGSSEQESYRMANDIIKYNENYIIIIVSCSVWRPKIVTKLNTETLLVGGRDLQQSPENSIEQVIIIGRKGLCDYNGVQRMYAESTFILTHNLNTDNRFFYESPTVQEVKLKSIQNDFFLEIYGFNLGQQKADLKSVEANLVACRELDYVNSKFLRCTIEKKKLGESGLGFVNVHLKDGKNSPQRVCSSFDIQQLAQQERPPINYNEERKSAQLFGYQKKEIQRPSATTDRTPKTKSNLPAGVPEIIGFTPKQGSNLGQTNLCVLVNKSINQQSIAEISVCGIACNDIHAQSLAVQDRSMIVATQKQLQEYENHSLACCYTGGLTMIQAKTGKSGPVCVRYFDGYTSCSRDYFTYLKNAIDENNYLVVDEYQYSASRRNFMNQVKSQTSA